jgi:hypothetical protein
MASSSTPPPTLGNPPAEKLTRGNHLLWKTLVLPALRGARLLGVADGSEPAPPETLEVEKEGKATTVPNPAYNARLVRDQQVKGHLSLSTFLIYNDMTMLCVN